MSNVVLMQNASGYEHIFIFVALVVLFILGMKKNQSSENCEPFVLDKNFSGALKGIAVVLILMTHYEQMFSDESTCMLRRFVARIPANVALVWFMFISGFGCTKSAPNKIGYLLPGVSRCLKVFLPMLFCFGVSILLYLILPHRFDFEEFGALHLPKEIYLFQNQMTDIGFVLKGMFRSYWYVWCILMYYVLFYVSSFLANRFNVSMTNILLVLMVLYYIAAFNIAGESYAHYYRLTWAFFLGHVFALLSKISPRGVAVYIVICAIPSAIFEARYMNFSFILSVLTLLFVSFLNKRFVFKSKALLFLGTVSFFFYLIHRRIAWVICCYLDFYGVVPWILISLLVSVFMWRVYSFLKLKKLQ